MTIKISNFSVSSNPNSGFVIPANVNQTINPVSISKFEIEPIILKSNKNNNSLTVSQFAEEASVTPQAVRKMIREGRLRATKIGNQYVVDQEALNGYLQER